MSNSTTESGAPVMRRLGDFILLEEIGRGGMGKVYHAKQVSLDREVALKVLPAAAVLDRDSVQRFKREAEAAGRLSHPGIVPIYAVGEVDDTYFYAMERVEGPSLEAVLDRLRDRPAGSLRFHLLEEADVETDESGARRTRVPEFLSGSLYPASCAAVIHELSSALTAAHQGQVIHRDIKPSNILLHKSGRPVLVDFGLARDELALSMTQTGEAVGTPVYMAPEQAAGSKMLDCRVDVYGLGVTLYEMLTLRPPFEGATAAEVMRAIIDEEPVSPRKLNPRVPRALETIVLTCLAKDKEKRYATTQELGEDLAAFLAGHEIRARRANFSERMMFRLRRNRRSAWVAVVSVLFALGIGAVVGLFSWNNTRQEGLLALDNAKILLLEGRVPECHAAYAQAEILLEDKELVAQQRLRMFNEVFETMYAKGRLDVLDRFLRTLAPEDLDWPEYHEYRMKLDGVGHVSVDAGPIDDVEISIRRIKAVGVDPNWRRLAADGYLKIGSYWIRIAVPGMAQILDAIEVERDKRLVLRPEFTPVSRVPPNMALVTAVEDGEMFAVGRTEVTIGEYLDELKSLPDQDLAAELRPVDWNRNAPERPVTGLSFRQARTVAALLGGHLMSLDEYRDAATGGLEGLPYPWGYKYDLDKVVGNSRTSVPAPVGSKPRGASPHGILDLVGNAAEMLSAPRGGTLSVAGGHYASDPSDLSVNSIKRLYGPDTQDPFVGMRIAKFLPVADDGKANGRVDKRMAELANSDASYVVNSWSLDDRGVVDLNQRFVVRDGVEFLDFPVLDGFHNQSVEARDFANKELSLDRSGSGGLQLEVPESVRKDRVRRVIVRRRMDALSGLHARLDSYVFFVPFVGRDYASITRVELPTGTHIDEIWPAPDEVFYLHGAPVLIWQRRAEVGSYEPFKRAAIRFRHDGEITGRWPATKPCWSFVEQLFGVVREGDRAALAPLLAEDCRYEPQGWDKAAILANFAILPQLSDLRLVDVTAVGEIVTVEMRAKWQRGDAAQRETTARNWPMRVQLRRTGDVMKAVRIVPATRPDLGTIDAGKYRHDRLLMEIEPGKGIRLIRRMGGMTELQLELRPPASKLSRGDHWITIAGCIDGSMDRDTVEMKLSHGSERWRTGTKLPGGKLTPLHIESSDKLARQDEHWLFEHPDGGFVREWWSFLSIHDRHFLVRCVATGRTPATAKERFVAHQKWFREVVGGLRIR